MTPGNLARGNRCPALGSTGKSLHRGPKRVGVMARNPGWAGESGIVMAYKGATGDHLVLVQIESHSSPFDHQSN